MTASRLKRSFERVQNGKIDRMFCIQWGSEIWNFKWSKRGWVGNGPDFEWDQKSDHSCPQFLHYSILFHAPNSNGQP